MRRWAMNEKKITINMRALITTVVCCVIIIIIGVLIGNHKKNINLDNYIDISFNGYDTMGTAEMTFDTESLEKDCGYQNSLFGISPIDFEEVGTLSENSLLSNGDKVTYTWNMADNTKEQLEKELDCHIKLKNITKTVSGLEELSSFDPFDSVNVTFDGVSGEGTVRVENINSIDGSFIADPSEELSNGDTITIYYSVNGYDPKTEQEAINEYFAENNGEIPSSLEKTYTVSGLPEYVKKMQDISDKENEELKAEAQDQIESYVAENSADNKYCIYDGAEYVGRCLLSAKDGHDTDSVNVLDMIFKVNLTLKGTKTPTNTDEYSYYCYVTFPDILVNADDISYDSEKVNIGGESLSVVAGATENTSGRNYTIKGFEDTSSLLSYAVSANANDYICEKEME